MKLKLDPKQQINVFIAGLHPSIKKKSVMCHEPKTIDQAEQKAKLGESMEVLLAATSYVHLESEIAALST